VTITPEQFIAMQERVNRVKVRQPESENPVERERDLHGQIIEWCDKQWPRWKYIHSRMDKSSTISVGAQDFTIFTPNGQTVCIECKRKGEKMNASQLAWELEMNRLGHEVYVVRSMDDFMACLALAGVIDPMKL